MTKQEAVEILQELCILQKLTVCKEAINIAIIELKEAIKND